jgi:hypothetical protein
MMSCRAGFAWTQRALGDFLEGSKDDGYDTRKKMMISFANHRFGESIAGVAV